MLEEFLNDILPPGGGYCVTTIDPNEPDERFKAKNRWINSVTEILQLRKKLLGSGLNLYFAVSSFTKHERRTSSVAYTKAFYLDLDVGPEPNKYPDKSDALKELASLSDLPPPVVVDSGTGIHAYWILDVAVPYAHWKPYADKFKAYCLTKLKIDPVVTGDAARIMRMPGTLNLKTTPPNMAQILSKNIHIYDFEMFKDFLGREVVTVKDILADIPKGLDDDTVKVSKHENFESLFQIIAEKSLAGTGCGQVRYCILNGRTLPEPLWHSILSIAQHCTDRSTAIHTLSDDYPQYDAGLTEAKATATQGKPQSCQEFNNRNPGICPSCKHFGKVTNPLILGRQLINTSMESPVWASAVGPLTGLPKELMPFLRGQHGGIYYQPPAEEDDKGNRIQDPAVLVSEHDIYPIKRVFNESDGASLLMRYALPKDKMREFPLPTSIFNKLNDLVETVGKQELTFSSGKGKYFMEYMIKWGQYLVNAQSAEQMRMQMGWTDDLNGFVIGHQEIRRDGKILKTAASPLVHSIAKLLTTGGDYNEWKRAANQLDRPGFEIHAFVMLCGFGSPLMRLTSVSGVSVGLVGGTGWGKTGALFAGLSLFGNPRELTLAGGKEQATANGLIGWFMGLKNIMLGLDESSNRKAEDLSNLIHQIAQGKGKIRMQGSVNAVRDLEMSASMIAVYTENQAIYDKLHMLKASPDGEVARMIEIRVEKPKAMEIDASLGVQIFDPFRVNFGFAGPEYILEVFKLGDAAVTKLIRKWIDRFTRVFGNDTAYRFYENLIGATFAGGEIAKNAGIINIDLDKIFTEVIASLMNIKSVVQVNKLDYMGVLGEFHNKFIPCTLYIEGGHVIKEPKGALVARAEISNKIYFVAARELKKFLNDIQVSTREFLIYMKAQGILIFDGKQRLARGWSGMNDTPVAVYGFKWENLPLAAVQAGAVQA